MTTVPKFGTLPDPSETLELLHGSSFIAKAKEEKALRILEQRRLAAAQRDKLVAAAEAAYPKRMAEEAAALDVVKKAEKALQAARERQGAIFREKLNASFAFQSEFDELTRTLIETANPAITLFIEEMRDEIARVRRMRVVDHSEVRTNEVTGRKTRVTESNANRIAARLVAIREAIADAEEMRLLPDQVDVPKELQKIRNRLPSAE